MLRTLSLYRATILSATINPPIENPDRAHAVDPVEWLQWKNVRTDQFHAASNAFSARHSRADGISFFRTAPDDGGATGVRRR